MKIYQVNMKEGCLKTDNSLWPQFLAGFSAGLLAVGTGMLFGWPAPSFPKLLDGDLGFEVTSEETSIVALIPPLGYLISSPTCALIFDKVGRKKLLLFLGLPQATAWILIATAMNIYTIYASRLISGIAEGFLFSSLSVYMCEIAEPRIRGTLSSIVSVSMIFGYTLINAYGSYLPIRTTAWISAAVPVLFVSTFIWMPESPYFLLMKGDQDAARKSLQRLRRVDNVDNELATLNLDVQRQTSESGKYKDLFLIKSNLKAFFIVLGVRTFQQFSGISAISIYLQVIFKQTNSGISPAQSALIFGFVQIIVTCFGSYLVDRLGRKSMYMFSSAAAVVILFSVGLYFYFQVNGYDVSMLTWLPLLGMILYVIFFSIGLGVVPNLMAGELFSVSIKAKALCLLNLYFALCLFSTFKIFHYLESSFGMHLPFLFFGVCCMVGLVFAYFFLPETQGKTLEEIQQILKGNSKKQDTESKI